MSTQIISLFLSLLFCCGSALALEASEIAKHTDDFVDFLDQESKEYSVKFSAPQYQTYDEESQTLIYKLELEYHESWECAPAPTLSGDACGPTGDLVKECKYYHYNPQEVSFYSQQISCDWPLSALVDLFGNSTWNSKPYFTQVVAELNKAKSFDYIFNFSAPEYITAYENIDGNKVYIFKSVIDFPFYDQEKVSGFSTECKYISFDSVDSAFEYSGECSDDIEDVLGVQLVDEL